MSILTKIRGKLSRKKKPKEGLPREKFLELKPIRNPLLKWTKSETGEVVITVTLPTRETPPRKGKKSRRKGRLSKIFAPPPPREKEVTLDKLGSFVWEMCDGKHRIEELVQGLCDEYKMMRREAEISLSSYLQQLGKRRFIGVLGPKPQEEEKEPSVLRDMKIP